MGLYSIAGFVVQLDNRYDYLAKQCKEYEYLGNAPVDFTVSVTPEDIQKEQNIASAVHYPEGYLESVCAYRNLCSALPARDAMLLHGSVISYLGRGIGFVARSGVGKTTHTLLWQQVYGDRIQIINGDKPILRFIEEIPYAYGTPWAGKENLQTNERVPLTDICLIERSPENSAFRIDPAEGLDALMQQVLVPADPEMAVKTLELLDCLLSRCKLWVIRCNISEEAAIVSHDAIIGEI